MIEWPNDDVLILCGASGSNEVPPPGMVLPNGMKATRYAGGSYTSLGEALTMLDIQVANEAQAGGYSFDIPEIGGLGYVSQVTNGINSTMWLDGSHSSTVVFDQMNDCMHSTPFTPEQADFYISNLIMAVNKAVGKKVIVLQLVPFEALDLPRALEPYGITETISAENYAILDAKHRAAFEDRADIIYLDAHKNMTTIDGLHKDYASQMKAAKIIKKHLS